MKLLLAALLCLLTFTSAHAQGTWPRNPKTGKVEFRGSLPWPANVNTEAQRRALVRRWYLAKLTEMSAESIGIAGAASKANAIFTYAGLPKAVVLQQGEGIDSYLLSYHVELTPTATSLKCEFTQFVLDKMSNTGSVTDRPPLNQLLPKATPGEQAALAAL